MDRSCGSHCQNWRGGGQGGAERGEPGGISRDLAGRFLRSERMRGSDGRSAISVEHYRIRLKLMGEQPCGHADAVGVSRAKMLRQFQSLRLVVRADALAVQRVG